MKKGICFLMTVLLALSVTLTAAGAEFTVDAYAAVNGMSKSMYQGYEPSVQNHVMTLCLPLRAESCVGDITVKLALEDPHVFLLSGEPKEVTVSPKEGIYPVKLTLPLQRNRRNGDYPATVTVRGTDGQGKEIVESLPYIIRVRDGSGSHETMQPVIADVISELNVGSSGGLTLTVANPTATLSLTGGAITVTDPTGEILMSGSDRFLIPEILPGKKQTVTIPMTVRGNASVSAHVLEISLRYQVLGMDESWVEHYTVPVTQEIRLEQGGVQMPTAIAGELSTMSLPLMNMGRGELSNVLVKLEMEGVLDDQSVLVGAVAAGESRQAKLTFTPRLDSVGTHSGKVTVTCEDAYGNPFTRTLEVSLTVDQPIPQEKPREEEEKEKTGIGTVVLIVLCVLLTAGLVLQGTLLTGKIHKLEEERL